MPATPTLPLSPRRYLRRSVANAVAIAGLLTVGSATAQPADAADPGVKPAADPAPVPAPKPPVARKKAVAVDHLEQALRPKSGGLTAKTVARRASTSNPAILAKSAEMRAAAAQVDAAMAAFFPRLKLTASYTRINVPNPSLGGGGGGLLGAGAVGPVSVGPCPQGGGQCVLDSAGNPVGAAALDFNVEIPANNYSLVANLSVPLSDYVLRLSSASAAAKANAKAVRASRRAERRKVQADGVTAYYNWVRGLGQVAVAKQAQKQSEASLKDARAALAAGTATKTDVVRLSAMVDSAKLAVQEAQAFADLAGEQLALMMGQTKAPKYALGENVLAAPKPLRNSSKLANLVREGVRRRPELQAIREGQRALSKSASAVNGARYPRVDAFAEYVYAKPGRNAFGNTGFQGSWTAGVAATWTINDFFTNKASVNELEANHAKLKADEAALRRGIRAEVTTAYFDRKKAKVAEKAARSLELAAIQVLDSKRTLLREGEGTTTDVIVAEQELISAMVRRLNAAIDVRLATIKLAYATGRKLPL